MLCATNQRKRKTLIKIDRVLIQWLMACLSSIHPCRPRNIFIETLSVKFSRRHAIFRSNRSANQYIYLQFPARDEFIRAVKCFFFALKMWQIGSGFSRAMKLHLPIVHEVPVYNLHLAQFTCFIFNCEFIFFIYSFRCPSL